MQLIKYMLLILLFISSSLLGVILSKKYKYRLLELEELKNAFQILQTKIKFTYEPLPEIFEEMAKKLNKNIGQIFLKSKEYMENMTAQTSWEKAVKESQNNLNQEDKYAILTLGKSLRTNRY